MTSIRSYAFPLSNDTQLKAYDGFIPGLTSLIQEIESCIVSVISSHNILVLEHSLKKILKSIRDIRDKNDFYHLTDFPIEDPENIENNTFGLRVSHAFSDVDFRKYDTIQPEDFLSEDISDLMEAFGNIILCMQQIPTTDDKTALDKLWGYVILHLLNDGFVPRKIHEILETLDSYDSVKKGV